MLVFSAEAMFKNFERIGDAIFQYYYLLKEIVLTLHAIVFPLAENIFYFWHLQQVNNNKYLDEIPRNDRNQN